jgi:hypothetical protein
MHAGRRKFLKTSFLGLAGLGIATPFVIKSKFASNLFKGHCPFEGDSVAFADDAPVSADPIMKLADPSQKDFAGDRFTRPHAALWHKADYIKAKGGIPNPSETVNVAVVGGGISGLTAAYSLQDLNPVVLDQATQFGGNAKGESWEGASYTIGAAYIDVPEEGSFVAAMLHDLGLDAQWKTETGKDEAITFKGKYTAPFWQGVTDPANAHEFKRVYDYLIEFGENSLPALPPVPGDTAGRAALDKLDAISFTQWIQNSLGKIHPHVEELLREYCWSSFGADADEVSAAQGLNFICADLVTVAAFPGGNSAITQALYDRLRKKLPPCSLRPGCMVLDISQDAKGVRVCYEGPDGALKTLLAKSCVVASAKFIAKVLVNGMPDVQQDAIDTMDYRAYVVANVLLKNTIQSPGYDIYCLQGTVPKDPKADIATRVYTDMTFSTWAQSDQTQHAVLSFFRPYAYDGGRKDIYDPSTYTTLQNEFQKAIPGFLTGMGLNPNDVVGIRLSRWGHALPVAAVGMISGGTLEIASAAVGNVFFGQQDNWASPCFESSVASAHTAADAARKAAGFAKV